MTKTKITNITNDKNYNYKYNKWQKLGLQILQMTKTKITNKINDKNHNYKYKNWQKLQLQI